MAMMCESIGVIKIETVIMSGGVAMNISLYDYSVYILILICSALLLNCV